MLIEDNVVVAAVFCLFAGCLLLGGSDYSDVFFY